MGPAGCHSPRAERVLRVRYGGAGKDGRMLLDHRHDVASELQGGWREEAASRRLATGGRQLPAAEDRHHGSLAAVSAAFARAFRPHHMHGLHLNLHGHTLRHGH